MRCFALTLDSTLPYIPFNHRLSINKLLQSKSLLKKDHFLRRKKLKLF
jgi:hypothetical protein